jgi:hypothetical protein
MTISKNASNLKRAMRTLADEPPKGKAAMIDWLWPEIAAGIKNRHRLKVIWERLCANGLQMKHNEFRTYVSRMKKKLPRTQKGREFAPAPGPAGDHGRQQASPLSTGAESAALAREYLKKGQGIEWKGTKDIDPDKLF